MFLKPFVLQEVIAITGSVFVVVPGRSLLLRAQWYRNMIPPIMLSLRSLFTGAPSTLAHLKWRGLTPLVGTHVSGHVN